MEKNKNTVKIEDNDATMAMFSENEIKTNKIAALSLLAIISIIAVFGILIVVSVIPTELVWTGWVMNISCLMEVLLLVIIRTIGINDRRTKYLVLCGVIFICGMIYFLYPLATVFIFGGTILLSIKYYDPKLSAAISAITWLVFILCVLGNFVLDATSAEVRSLHMEQGFTMWSDIHYTVIYYVLPISLVSLIEGTLAYHISKACGKMVVNQGEISSKAALLSAEMVTASKIQASSLPSPDFTAPDGRMTLSAGVSTARNVGGDFYDYFMVDDHLLVVAVADVSDKGLPAAMYAVEAQSYLRFAFFESFRRNTEGEIENINLEHAVNAVNRQLSLNNMDGMFVTMWVGCFDTRTGMGKYVNAGHLPPYVIHSDGSTTQITNDPQFFMGIFEDAELKTGVLRLMCGDTLALFTDGATDARNVGDETFGEERLRAALSEAIKNENEEKRKPLQLKRAIFDTLGKFSGDVSQYDDITFLSLLYSGNEPTQKSEMNLLADGESAEKIIDFVQNLLVNHDCPEKIRRNIGVIIDDVCTNISDYAYNGETGPLRVEIHLGKNFISLSFEDRGMEFNPLTVELPDTEDEPQIGGLGIHLVKNLSDDIRYSYDDGKNILTVLKIWNM